MNIFVSLILSIIIVISLNVFSDGTPGNVILITFDGVRWQEVFNGTDPQLTNKKEQLFKILWEKYAKNGLVLGDKNKGSMIRTGNPVNISLPEYQALMSGVITPCQGNGCSQIKEETFMEKIQKDLDLKFYDIGVVASWETIKKSVASVEGSFLVNTGITPLIDEQFPDSHKEINELQKADKPKWGSARKDKYTFLHAKNFIKNHKPRFFYISFDDSDEWGHLNEYEQYCESLKMYDRWIDELITMLKAMPGYGENTTLIFTTDHGRGDGKEWTSHGPKIAGSENIWAFIYGPDTPKLGSIINQKAYTHLNFFLTIESFITGEYPKMFRAPAIVEAFKNDHDVYVNR
ncbi:MAG: alkaline phosphatase family protein [Bacteriovoracaceae bacterium]